MEAGTICETGETGETGENAVVFVVVEQIEFLTGLTVSPVFPLFPCSSKSGMSKPDRRPGYRIGTAVLRIDTPFSSKLSIATQ